MNIFENKINAFRDTLDAHLIDIYKSGPDSLKKPINIHCPVKVKVQIYFNINSC